MSDYEAKKAARIERMRARAERVRAEGEARLATADRIASAIPMGQPILVGHHSERRHRRDIARIDANMSKGVAALDAARDLERRANRAETSTAISSDDPEAIVKLRAQLAEVEADADHFAASVKAARAVLARVELAERAKALAAAVDCHGRPLHAHVLRFIGVMGFVPTMANVRANVRRIKERLAGLEQRAAEGPKAPETIGDVEIAEEENRVRVRFPGKPSEEIRKALRSAGFVWSPSAGAWQRKPSESAWYWARKIAGSLTQGAA